MSNYDGPTWLNFTIRHVENDPAYHFDGYTIEIEMEVREAGDEDGDTSRYQSWYVASDGYSVSYHGEGWCWDEDGPQTITWRNLRRKLKQAVLLDCLKGLEHLKPVEIWFDDESESVGNRYGIDPKKYGIDIEQYLYKGE
jgi:hypothetical protein